MSGTSRLQMVSSHLRWSVPKSGKSRCVLFSNVLQPGITGLARKSWKFQLERSLFEDGKFLEGTCSSITVCCYCFPSSESSFRLCFTLRLCANALLDEGFPFFYTWGFFLPFPSFCPYIFQMSRQNNCLLFCVFRKSLWVTFWSFFHWLLLSILPPSL